MKEFKVNLKPLIKKLEIQTKRGIYGGLTGGYRSVFRGRGLEFDAYRKYDPSHDDADRIDWKASLRANKMLVKEYVEERNLYTLFLLDVGSTMSFASVEKLKNEYAAEVVANLSFAMIEAGDSVGMVMFSNDMKKGLQPDIGTQQYYNIIRSLTDPKMYEGKFDFSRASKIVSGWTRARATLVIISDFLWWNNSYEKEIVNLSANFELIAIMIRDPRDDELPEGVGQVVIKDPESNAELLIDCDIIKEKYAQEGKRQIDDMKKVFSKHGVDLLEMKTDKSFVKPIMSFFEERNRR